MKHFNFFFKSRWLLLPLLLLTLSVSQMWGITTNDLSTSAATAITNGGQYVVATAYDGTYLTTEVSSGWGTASTDIDDAAIFTAHGSASGFYLTCSEGRLVPASSKTFNSYDNGTANNLSLNTSTGAIQNSSSTSWTLRLNGNFRWYGNTTGSLVCLFEVSSGCSGDKLDSPNVTAIPSSGQVQLTWPNVTGATKYQVSWNGGAYADATSPYTKNSLTNGTTYTWAVKAIGDGEDNCDSDPAEGSTKAGTAYAITWKVNGETYKTTYVSNGDHLVLPTNPDVCKTGTEFVGWSATSIGGTPSNTKPTFVSSQTTISSAQTYHAVFATKTANSYSLGDVNDLLPGQKVLIVNKNNYALSNSNNGGKLTAKSVSPSSSKITTTDASIIWTVENDGTKYKFKNTYYLYAYQTNTNTSLYCDGDDSKYSDSWTATSASSSYYYLYSDRSTSSKRLEYYTSNTAPKNFFTTYTSNTTDYFKHSFYVPTYSGYFTSCCTPLGQIKGSINWTNGSKATLVWNKDANATGYVVKWKTHAGGENTYSTTNVSNINDTLTNKKTCAIYGLEAGTSYDFKIFITGKTTPTLYCDIDSVMTATAPKITASGTLTGSDYAYGSGSGIVKSFNVSGTGLEEGNLTFSVPTSPAQHFEISTDGGTNWSSSETLAVSAGDLSATEIKVRLKAGLAVGTYSAETITISGCGAANNTSVTIAGEVTSACQVPSIGNAALTSIASGKITVSCPTISGGDNCDVTDYGFIWKEGSAPTMESKDGIAQVGTNNQATAFNKELSISFTTGHTYYIKAYATNSAGTNVSATALQVKPQSVTFDSKGGSAVATVYVNYNTAVSQPSNPTKDGHDFSKWQKAGEDYSFSTAVTADITLDAVWTVHTHTLAWVWNGGSTSGSYTAEGTKNYGATITYPVNNTMSKTGYNFANFTSSPEGNPTAMPDQDLTITANWTAKTYGITLDREGATTGSESVTMTYNANTHTAITAPSKDGYIFGGWYAEDNGEGAQVMNASGTLQANVEGFTGANGIWTKDATCTLYAKWTPITFKVAFDANGGTGDAMDDQNFTYDVSQKLSANTYTAPLHKYFYGWHSIKASADAGTREHYDEQSVQNLTTTNGATVTLYAVWKDHTYTNYRTKCCTPLAAPTNIVVSVTGAETATVTWDAVADATGYEYKLGDGEWTDTEIAGNEANPELSLSGLTGATNYTLYVRTNGNGDNCAEGTPSAGTNFRTLSTVTAAENDALMGTAKVSLNNSDWYDAVETTDGTTIYLQATAGSLYQFNGWSDPSSGTISSNQLTDWSGNVTVTANFIAKELTKLATPTGMGLVGDPGATSATIKWNAVDHANGYEVVCAGATIGDVTVIDGVASCPLTLLTVNTTYNWTVKALGDGISFEDGDACASQSFKTDLKKPTAIEITHAPTVTEYLEGESFATAGMVVKVTYNNGDIDGAYSTYTIDPSGALTFGTTSVTVTATLNGQSRSTTQAITVHKKYTLTFKNNGQTILTYNLKEGDAYNAKGDFPSAGAACDGTSTTFMGWSTAVISEKQSAAPAVGYASPTDVMGTSNVILNAVWAKEEGHEGYSLVTAPTADKTYIFVASNTAGSAYALDAKNMNTSTSSGAKSPAKAVTVSSGTPVYVGTVDEDIEFVFSNNKYSIVSLTNQYFYINGNGVSRRSSAQGTWDNDNGLYATSTSGQTTYYLSLDNSDPENVKFYYATSAASANRVYAYEKQEASYTDYLTTCCDEWSVTASYGEGNVISVSDGAVAVTLSDLAYGTASYESSDEDVLTVASDGKVTGKKAGSATVTIAWAGIPGSKCAFETSVDVTVNGPITVTYNANDGSDTPATKVHEATVNSNSEFTLEANTFVRTGYTFQGWATTPSGAKAYDDKQANVEFAESTTLYAVWAINSYAVTLTQPTGNEIKANNSTTPGNVNYGTTVNLTATENDGYVFTGWSVTGATVADASAKSTSFTMPDNAVTVSASFNTYTWNFVNYTVSPTPGTSYTDADLFDKSAYTVTANYERSDTKTPKAVDLDANDWTAKLNGTAIATDYEFAAGDDGKELAFYVDETKVWSANITVTEVDKDRFIDGLWGNTTIIKKEANYTVPTLTQTPGDAGTCDNHTTFIGWVLADDAENPTDDNKVVGGTTGQTPTNKTYYAIWAEHYSGNKDFDASKTSFASGETGSSSSVSVNTDIRYSTVQNGGTNGPAVLNSGVLRLYRKNSGDMVGSYITISAASGATISEVEFEVATTNAVKYRAGAYSAGNMSDVAITDGKVTVSGLSVSQFTLANADGAHQLDISSIAVAYSKHVEEDRDYIIDCDPRYDVEFSAGIGATGSYDKVTKKAGVEITLPDGTALSKEHHTFAGWYSAHYDVTYSESTSMTYTVPVDGETLVAQWTEDHHAFVTFKNGENTIGEPLKVYDGGVFNLLGAQEADGKAFIGWKWNGNMYDAGQVNQHMGTPAENRTYTAVWMPILAAPSIALTDGEWVLVTNKNQLFPGDFVVIAAAGYDVALSNYQKTSNRDEAAVTKDGNKLTFESNVAPLFLQFDPESDLYAFYDRAYSTTSGGQTTNTGYLCTANNLKTEANVTRNSVWAISITDNKASIVAQVAKGTYEKRTIRYNATTNTGHLFQVYESTTQQDVAIYKWIETVKTEGTVNASDVMPAYNVNLVVQADSKITVDQARTVNDFIIEAMEGHSGQILNPDNLNINGNAYYDLTLNTSGKMDNTKWYAFAVPFQVDAKTGIQRLSNSGVTSNASFNSHYVILKYNSAMYAENNTNGWEYVTAGETLMPGNFYMIALNSNEYNRVRMTKKAGEPLNNKENLSLAMVGTGMHANWNALANNALAYANVSATGANATLKVQVYNSENNQYLAYDYDKITFTVGTPFFLQVAEEGTMSVDIAATTNETVKAPRRYETATEEFQIRLGADTESYYDQLYVSASEDALNEYQIGHDLAKAGVSTTVPQMYVPAYGGKLCDAEFPLVNNEAIFPLTFTAPKAGTYQLYIAQAAQDAELYLQRDGNVIWNLSGSAYALELPQGTTTAYSLLLKAKAQMPTGLESGEVMNDANGVQKLIIDQRVYILRGGQMYDITGKAVK